MAEIFDIRARLSKGLNLQIERSFLKNAANYLRCRYQVMTGHCYVEKPFKITHATLGMIDWQNEMKLQAKEFLDLLRR